MALRPKREDNVKKHLAYCRRVISVDLHLLKMEGEQMIHKAASHLSAGYRGRQWGGGGGSLAPLRAVSGLPRAHSRLWAFPQITETLGISVFLIRGMRGE